MRQLLDLSQLWAAHDYFFVTEDTALGKSVAEKHPTEFIPHFAVGQAKLGAPLVMLQAAWRSIWQSLRIVRRRRPSVVITTGAGSQLFILIWARLLGARIILIDSFARFEKPSLFARLAGPLAHRRYAQSHSAGANWAGAEVHDPVTRIESAPPEKEPLVFATVGATLAFDRLTSLVLQAMREGVIHENVVLQTGTLLGDLPPGSADIPGLTVVENLRFDEVRALLRRASIVICHGGTGSIITALQNHCRTIVIPRRFGLGEHYDDHQAEITESLEKRGLLFSAHDEASLRNAIERARAFTPIAVTTDYGTLIESIRTDLASLWPELRSATAPAT